MGKLEDLEAASSSPTSPGGLATVTDRDGISKPTDVGVARYLALNST
jgi:hypothetical protein